MSPMLLGDFPAAALHGKRQWWRGFATGIVVGTALLLFLRALGAA